MKSRRSKSARNLSPTLSMCFRGAIVLWGIHGFMLDAFPVILVNAVTLCIAVAIPAFKIRYG